MLYTIDEWRETECLTPLIFEERDKKIYNIDEWSEAECFTPLMKGVNWDPLHNLRMETNGMLYTIDEWKETGCLTPLTNGDKRNA